MDTVAAYHFGWIDAEGRPADGDGGKAVRPRSPCCPRRPRAGRRRWGTGRGRGRAGAQLLLLLHDDLMDGDEQRRHRDTVWKVHGPAQAILVGDALFALANEILLELGTVEAGRATRRLTRATRALIDGQAQDISYEHRDRVSVEECLEMEGNKRRASALCLLHRRGPRRRRRRHRRHPGEVRLPPRPRVPGRRRPPRHLGRPGGNRKADLERPAPAQEVPAGGGRPGGGRSRLRAPGGDACRGRQEQRLRELLRGGVRAARAALIEEAGGRECHTRRRVASTPSPSRPWSRSGCPRRCAHGSRRSPTSSSYERDDHYRSNTPRVVAGRSLPRSRLLPQVPARSGGGTPGSEGTRIGQAQRPTADPQQHYLYDCTKGKP